MKTEEQIKKELNEMLSKEIDNRSTVILIEAKIADLCQVFFDKKLTIPNVMQWVATSDRLPTYLEEVLAADSNGNMRVTEIHPPLTDKEWFWGKYTYWMQLPERPCA